MITLRKITLENRRVIFNLEVSENQRRFVASNLSSAASCYVLATNGGYPLPFAIYADEQPVGFVMLTYGITGYEDPSIAEGNYCILRLMIDKQYQSRGYAREAMKKILEFIRTFPAGPAHYCWIPYSADNYVAKRLYESFGFRDNGEICNNESITVLRL
ncbi:GNAT family N-acetyltransferase [Paenibacillus crassostreae]|uniref:GCN5 family acetyltransferase n=1 Tax=Paenibacillus crassostreae TaxID=1763538 RepID=A0A167F7U2_9BACL|nr:GNAT family N-acetyltransferase [Paenibacillus crassostreae]AOZ90950.1 GNAT family N-acetyltransferase [Paenibacillus crassostreae]OAB76282.1 GCN5 family acetyltransferase [Paenibacillus crassostreae]